MTSQPATRPLSGATITAAALAVLGAVIALFLAPGLKLVGMLLAIAALVVGAAAIVNGRRRHANDWVAWATVAVSVVTLVGLAVWRLS